MTKIEEYTITQKNYVLQLPNKNGESYGILDLYNQ